MRSTRSRLAVAFVDIPILGDQLDEATESIDVEVVDWFSTTSPDESTAQVHIHDDDSPSSR
jgi:hypothetical protein